MSFNWTMGRRKPEAAEKKPIDRAPRLLRQVSPPSG
jgi:hypothetical protein